MANGLNFFSGLLQGFAQTQERQRLRKEDDDEKKARLRLIEIQIDREKREQASQQGQQDALKQLFSKLQGTPAAAAGPPNGIPDAQGPVSTGMPAKPPTLTELLADPSTAMLMLRSGMLKGGDLLDQEKAKANRAMMEKLIGGAGGPKGMEMQGLKVGPSGELMPDFGLPQVTSPQAIETPDGPRLRTFNPRTGATVADLGAPKEEKRTPEEAGRISGLVQAQEIGQNVRAQFIKADGTIDRALVMTSFAKAAGTKGRSVRNDMQIAIDAVLRARTGAGVNDAEMKQVVEQFLPGPLDSDAGIAQKLDRFDQFISGALDVATLPARIRKKLEEGSARGGDAGATNGRVIDFSQLPP